MRRYDWRATITTARAACATAVLTEPTHAGESAATVTADDHELCGLRVLDKLTSRLIAAPPHVAP